MPATTSPATSPGPTTSGRPWVRLVEKSTWAPARSAPLRCPTTASFTSGGTSICPPSKAMTPMAALLSADTVRMPRDRSSRDAPASSFCPWACASAFFWSRACCWASSWARPSTTSCGHRRPSLLGLRLGALELLARLVDLGLSGLQLRRPRRELSAPGVDLLLLRRELRGGLEGVGDGADALHRPGGRQRGADRRALLVGERRAVGGVEDDRAVPPARRRQRRPELVGDLSSGGAGDRDRGREGAVPQRIRTAGEPQQGHPDDDDETGPARTEATESVEEGGHGWCFRRRVVVTVSGRRRSRSAGGRRAGP